MANRNLTKQQDSVSFPQNDFRVGDRTYSRFNPYLIAEIGVNHEGSLSLAKEQIRQAARAGAHAVKFQSYTADKLASPSFSPPYWDTTKEATPSQHALFSKFDSFGLSQYVELAEEAQNNGVDFMTTPFDEEIAEELSGYVSAFKIASADLTNLPLLRKVLSLERPTIFSCGAATPEEIRDLAAEAKQFASTTAFLHCVLNYPTAPENANLLGIPSLSSLLGSSFTVGYSDHVPPEPDGSLPALQIAFMLGATIIEKHFTDDRTKPGNDHYHATDEKGLEAFVEWCSEARILLGTGSLDIEVQAKARDSARRRIFLRHDVAAGQPLQAEDLIPLRSNVGLPIIEWDSVVGGVPKKQLKGGEPLRKNDLL